ncbi:hypothetical protein SERLA73DRAFT_108396 [Serpula lacrymans var. lacrymans S7.3]|uniref:BZIP domain-containing protein n=2 Tax=Serpula lacrymans var. lacrymans TaxID=341189 RepID=F8PYX4_SERL3|nr:uncharacterized protein SERLADRAFT_449420 [Serpula lacrymans var. lacrymans S7.9]EGN99087.1 hypothetical protein SERLA73DRAFT_108396 [Serpula lacrymans var. lacrymans S7.3]EGO24660.1 hypothetical protein SERLADRAFT_449420 [Serpula lacrymans var. lacrymans S7.9]
MSSKRGRKRNDNLPPNRARDVQRAFRARRAAHLQALELRVAELEEENNCLRAALNLPPASRPSLGKGPTGKDKPKSIDDLQSHHPSSMSRDSSSAAESPSPTRTDSVSPSIITNSMRASPRNLSVMEPTAWEDSMIMTDQQQQAPQQQHQPPPEPQISSSSTPYHLPAVSAPMLKKNAQQFTFPNPMSTSSRNSMSNSIYMPPSQSSFSHTADRPMGGGYNDMSYLLREDTHHHYSYSQPSFSPADHNMQTHPASAQQPMHQQTHASHREPAAQPPPTLPFPHRRSVTEPQGYRTITNQLPHLPNPVQQAHGIRLPSPPTLHDVNGPRHAYTNTGSRMNVLP